MISSHSLKSDSEASFNSYIEPLAMSYFSFLAGASSPERLIDRALSLGYRGLILSERHGFFSVGTAWRYLHYLQTRETLTFSLYFGARLVWQQGDLVIIPKSERGYRILCQLLSRLHYSTSSWKQNSVLPESPREIRTWLSEPPRFEDWLVLAVAPLPLEILLSLQDRGWDLHLALWRHRDRESWAYTEQAFSWEKKHALSLVVGQNAFYADSTDAFRWQVLRSIKENKPLSQLTPPKNYQAYLHSLEELRELWAERQDLLSKTQKLCSHIAWSFQDLKVHYPKTPLPPQESRAERLKKLCYQKIHHRLPQGLKPEWEATLNKELHLIAELGYEDYFLTLYELVQWAESQGILFQGRGSAANSLVCYLLGLTAVGPDQLDMLFERFISPHRVEPPDIDIDFAANEREKVIQWIWQRYPGYRAVQVATVVSFQARSALRWSAKVLGIAEEKIKPLQRYLRGKKLWQVDPEMVTQLGLPEKKLKLWIQTALSLIDVPYHLSLHPSGFVLSDEPLNELSVVIPSPGLGHPMMAWTKDDLDTLGIIKVDILSLGMLEALQKAFRYVKNTEGHSLGLYQLPPQDSKTYKLIQAAQTVGVFQIESRAQMSLLPRLKPREWYDLCIQIAMVRPGPIEGGLVEPFLKHRFGRKKPSYPLPELAPVLDKTHGVPIFQEQIMRLLMICAGFSLAEADGVRRLLGQSRKSPEAMARMEEDIHLRMSQRGLPESFIQRIIKTLRGFSAYGFPESHAASFAHIAYATAFIKAHYPAQWLCALLNSYPLGFYPPRVLIDDAKSFGVQVLPIHLIHSRWDFTMEKLGERWAIREGYRLIKGMPYSLWLKLESAFKKSPPSLSSLAEVFSFLKNRCQITDAELSFLIRLGALHPWASSNQQALWQWNFWRHYQKPLLTATAQGDDRQQVRRPTPEINTLSAKTDWSEQDTTKDPTLFNHSLSHAKLPPSHFWNSSPDDGESILLPTLSDLSQWQLHYEKRAYSLNSHPVAVYKNHQARRLQGKKLVRLGELPEVPEGWMIEVCVLITMIQRPPTAGGVCFLTVEDETGIGNVLLWPQSFDKWRWILEPEKIFIFQGTAQNRSGVSYLVL
jgi:DNA polymerase-3 subunit alpha/error-prone DNA polymerase